MKEISILTLFSASFFISNAQSFDPYVIGSSGTYASSATAYVTVVSNPASQNISVYPNPVVDNLVIDFSFSSGNYSVEIVDMQGQLLRKENVSSNEKRLGISFHDFANGMYLLNIVNSETYCRNSYKINKAE